MDKSTREQLLRRLKWNEQGLIPAIALDAASGEVLMLAWMNEEALLTTLNTNKVHYYSRSRRKLWQKGETSGHGQLLKKLRLDCDGDALLLDIVQGGGIACHTGRRSCFFYTWTANNWEITSPVLKTPEEIYPKKY